MKILYKPRVIFIDMDGVLADFKKAIPRLNGGYESDPPEMMEQGFFRDLEVMPGASDAIMNLMSYSQLKLFVATKPTTKNLYSTIEKYQWIQEHFPVLVNRMFLTCDKQYLVGDYLIDDDLRWSNFNGTFIYFDESDPEESWIRICEYFTEHYK